MVARTEVCSPPFILVGFVVWDVENLVVKREMDKFVGIKTLLS